MKKYNDGGVTLRQAFEEAKRESSESGEAVEFEFALVKVVVNGDSRFEVVETEWRKGVGGISYTTKQL